MSPQGKQVSSVTFQTFAYISEAIIFQYIGFTLIFFREYAWSWSLILSEIFIIVIGRFIGVVVLIYSLRICKHKSELTFKELCFIAYSGLIRGAIAFGLVLEITTDMVEQEKLEVIVTTQLALVAITTCLFGSTIGIANKILLPEEKNPDEHMVLIGSSENLEDEAPKKSSIFGDAAGKHLNNQPFHMVEHVDIRD